MAPDTVNRLFRNLPKTAIILDPMCGSGAVLRSAAQMGFQSFGYDIDPLAVLMSRVWTKKSPVRRALHEAEKLIAQTGALRVADCKLSWIDDCPETKRFVGYWFAAPQRRELRRLSYLLTNEKVGLPSHLRDCLWLALSRVIITKHAGASLAWDIPHSRPHKVRDENDFDVKAMFLRSTARLVQILEEEPIVCSARVRRGDCRGLASIGRHSIDVIITSPPYLNAIDYLRGHKFSLVWMGYSLPTLRKLRATSIGTEAAGLKSGVQNNADYALNSIREFPKLPRRQQNIVRRYATDASAFLSEARRLMKPGGSLSLVLGDSNVRGYRVENSKLFSRLANAIGFRKTSQHRRQLQQNRRYLPIKSKDSSLENRMNYEVIQTYIAL